MNQFLRNSCLFLTSLISLWIFYYFLNEIISMYLAVNNLEPIILVSESSYYLLFGLIISWASIAEFCTFYGFAKWITRNTAKVLFLLIFLGGVLPFTFPSVTATYLSNHSYAYCPVLSSQIRGTEFQKWVITPDLCSD